MRISERWAAVMVGLSVGAAVASVAAGCGSSKTTTSSGTGGTTSSSSTGGGSTTTSTTTGTGGAGGMPGPGPFTSEGASSYEAQTSLAADAKGNAVAAWVAFFADGSSSVGYTVSHDTGTTWTPPAYLKSPGGLSASNPVVAIDGQARIFATWLGFDATSATDDSHVYLAKMDSATNVFGAPVNASDDGTSMTLDYDKPGIAVDANDDLLLTWSDFNGSTPSLTFARSSDAATFTRTTIVSGATFGNLAYLCLDTSAGPTAPLNVVHLGSNATLVLHQSMDQGATWQIGGAVPATSVVFQAPSCVAHGSDLWIDYASGMAAFSSSMDAPGSAVQVTHSANGGAAFDAPVTVSDGAAGTQYLFPAMVRAASGKLQIVYYQGTSNAPATLTGAVSPDGSAWTTSAMAMPGTFTLDRTLASWLGDYLGIASPAGSTFVSYTQNSQGKAHIALSKTAAP